MPMKLLYISPSLPTLTCTFIYREIFDLRDLGFEVNTVSMNRPPDDKVSPEAVEFLSSTLFLDHVAVAKKFLSLPMVLFTHPIRLLSCFLEIFRASPTKSFRDYKRLCYHLVSACYLSRNMSDDVPDHIHCHFVTGATSIGMFLSRLLAVPYSFTMHASAIWIDPIALKNKLRTCQYCVSISAYNKRYIIDTYGKKWSDKINVIHCGISFSDLATSTRKAREPNSPVNVLAVGQLMLRKGYHVLVEAARILKENAANVRFTVVGEGPQRPRLEKLIDEYHLQDMINMVGAQPHEEIPAFLDSADIFTLPCIIGNDNTRDGIPVAMMEAMASQLPVVSTNIVGLPELIESGVDGVLVEPENPAALAMAIQGLAESASLRKQIGAAATKKVEQEFNSVRCARQLADLFNG